MGGDNKSRTLGMARPAGARAVKATHILDVLKQGIHNGDYAPGTRLPTEFELTGQFKVSRPTAAKALNELERLGLVERIPGSGSYVKRPPQGVPSLRGKTLGLLIPGLGTTEIFEPVCGSLAACAESSGCTLVWGSCHDGASAGQLCLRYVQQRVDGVFFAPLELLAGKEEVNSRILDAFDQAGITVVLLDRDAMPFPRRTNHDLVGLDNTRAAFILTSHLIGRGCTRIHFLARPFAAPTLEERVSGYWAALLQAGLVPSPSWVHRADPGDPALAGRIADSGAEAVICSNDANAVALMDAFEKAGLSLPKDMKVAGFDDVSYARHVKIPLTTIRQPCAAIGMAAFDAMTSRLASPALPPRTIRLEGELIVRTST